MTTGISNHTPDASQPGTFAANALSCAVCITNIDILTDKNYNLMGRAATLGAEIINELRASAKKTNIIGDVRGRESQPVPSS
jgi:4-aminobutyrate aminotransferase